MNRAGEREDSDSSDESRVLAGNIHAHVSTRNKKSDNKLRRRRGTERAAPLVADSDCSSVFQERGVMSNCKNWQRMESTHVQHASNLEQVLTEEEEEEEEADSYLTEDNTMYDTALEQEQDSTKESGGATTFVTAKDKLSDRAPTTFSASSSSLMRTGMSAQLLFSVGKRKSILPRQVNSRPVLAEDSDEDDGAGATTGNEPSPLSSWTRRTKTKTPRRAPRRSILGRNEVVLLSSDSDDDFFVNEDENDKDKRVDEWIHESPPPAIATEPRRDLSDFRAETFEVTEDLDLSSAHSERTSKCTEQIRTLTLVEISSEEDDEVSVPKPSSEATSKNWRPDSRSRSVGVGHDLSEEFLTDDFDGNSTKDESADLSSEATSKRLAGQLEQSGTARSDAFKSWQAQNRSLQVSLTSDDEDPCTSVQRLSDAGESDHDTSVVVEQVSPQGPAPKGSSKVLRRRSSSSSSDDNLQEFLQQLRKRREAAMAEDEAKREASQRPMDSFIVDDDDEEEEEEDRVTDGDSENDDDGADESNCFDVSAEEEEEEENDDDDEEDDSEGGAHYSESSDDNCSSNDEDQREAEVPVIDLGDTSEEENEDEEDELPDLPTPSPPKKEVKKRAKPLPRNNVPVRAPFTPINPNAVKQSDNKLSFLQSLSLVQADDR